MSTENLQNNETSSVEYPFSRMETATEIVFGNRISGTLASATDEAWYRFTTTNTSAHLHGNMGMYEVNMFDSDVMNLYFYETDGTLVAASESYQIPYYALDLAYNRTYYLCVKPHYNGAATYALDTCIVNQQSWLQSKFTSSQSLDIVNYGTEISGTMEAPFEPAWYNFYTSGFSNHNNNEPNEYYISAVGEQESITVLYDSDKKEIARHYNDGTAAGSKLTVTLDANKYYYICIKAPGNIFAEFDLSVEYHIQPFLGSCMEAAIRLTNGQNYDEEFFSSNEDKWFKFTATEHEGNIGGYSISGIMSFDFNATLFDSDGNVIQPVNTVTNPRDFCFWCAMGTNDTYYLRVTSRSENGGAFYVQATETPSILNTGTSMSDAITIYNIYTPVEGAITTPGQSKWYKFTVDGHYDKIIVHSTDSEIELQAELYTTDNELICSDTEEDSNPNFRMEPTVTPFYTYYLKVTGMDNSTGSFKVRWSNGFYAEAINLPDEVPIYTTGTTVDFSSAITPSDAGDLWIDWSVIGHDSHIATIDRYGVAKILSPGAATIEVSSGDIRERMNFYSYIQAQSVSFVESSYEMHNGEEVHAELDIYPSTASSIGVVFNSSNPAVAEYDEDRKTIKAKAPGTATISVTVNGVTSSCSVVVKEKVVVSRFEQIGHDLNGELRVHFTHSNRLWHVVNKDTLYCNDPLSIDYAGEIDRVRCNYNAYEDYDPDAQVSISAYPMIEYSDDEIRMLYVIDPFGVADYVLKYSEKMATADRTILDIKDEFYYTIFGRTPQRFAIENGGWRPATPDDPDTAIYSESETVFGANLTFDGNIENILKDFVIKTLEFAIGKLLEATPVGRVVRAVLALYSMVAIRKTTGDTDFNSVVDDWARSNFFEDHGLDWLNSVLDSVSIAITTIQLNIAIEQGRPEFSEHAEYFNEFDGFDIFIEA